MAFVLQFVRGRRVDIDDLTHHLERLSHEDLPILQRRGLLRGLRTRAICQELPINPIVVGIARVSDSVSSR